MKRLMETQLFKLRDNLKGTFDPGGIDMQSLYDDFVHAVVLLCTSLETRIPIYFTFHYTRLELQQLISAVSTQGAGEKYASHTLHRKMYRLSRQSHKMD